MRGPREAGELDSEDALDRIAAGLFAIAAVVNGFWGVLLTLSLVGFPLGIVSVVVAARF